MVLLVPISRFSLLHKSLAFQLVIQDCFIYFPPFIAYFTYQEARVDLSDGLCQAKDRDDISFAFCSTVSHIYCLLRKYTSQLPLSHHKQIYSPEKGCGCWNPASLTTLDQRQSVSIVYVGSKIKTFKSCKNNKQKAPNKWTENPWANKRNNIQLSRRSSFWIQSSGVTGNLNNCVNMYAFWQYCYPWIWQLSEPGKSLTHYCHKSA